MHQRHTQVTHYSSAGVQTQETSWLQSHAAVLILPLVSKGILSQTRGINFHPSLQGMINQPFFSAISELQFSLTNVHLMSSTQEVSSAIDCL